MAVTLSDLFPGSALDGAKWTASNAGAGSNAVASGLLTLSKTSSGSDVARVVANSASAWDVGERVSILFGSAPTVFGGLALRGSTNFAVFVGHNPGTGNCTALSYNISTNRLGGSLGAGSGYQPSLAIQKTATNVNFQSSPDGSTWTTFFTDVLTNYGDLTSVTPVLIAEDWFNTAAAGTAVFDAFNPVAAAVPAVVRRQLMML